MYSEKLEEVIAAALQDGKLTEQKRNIIKRRAEKEDEDVEEVMMVVESRLLEVTKAPHSEKEKKRTSATSKPKKETVPNGNFTETVNGVSFNMIRVEGGTFAMFEHMQRKIEISNNHSPDLIALIEEINNDSEGMYAKIQNVTLDDYYIGETLVTQALWNAVMGKKPSPFYFKGDLLPVNNISWKDCQAFLEKLNKLTKKNYHLPSEAQWEYAAIGGKYSLGYKYAGSDDCMKVAWCWDNTKTYTDQDMIDLYNAHHFFKKAKEANFSVRNYFFDNYENDFYEIKPVALLRPNELGLYDMSGNVWEFCEDDYDLDPILVGKKNPIYKRPNCDSVVCRGGSCEETSLSFLADARACYSRLDTKRKDLGFRIVL